MVKTTTITVLPFNSVGYICRLLWTKLIQYRLCSCLHNSSYSPSLHFATACCSFMVHAQTIRLCSWGACRACQEAASRYFASPLALFLMILMCLPRGTSGTSSCSCIHRSFTSPPCGAVQLQLPSGTTFPTRDWTPLWHSFGSSLWHKSLLLRARSCQLVPLY